jgi:prevent-host-death family protein
VAGLVAEAERGADLVVTRRNHPVAAVVGIGRLALLEAAGSVRYVSVSSVVQRRLLTDDDTG